MGQRYEQKSEVGTMAMTPDLAGRQYKVTIRLRAPEWEMGGRGKPGWGRGKGIPPLSQQPCRPHVEDISHMR